MQVDGSAELKNQNNKDNEHGSRPGWTFGRVIKGFVILDAAFVLFLMSGFVLPGTPVRDPNTGGMPENYYDYSAKVSPLTPPVSESKQPKVEVEIITARGDNPTFVPPPSDDGEAQFENGAYAVPASLSAGRTAAENTNASELGSPAGAPADVVPASVRQQPNESPTPVPGARVEPMAVRHTS